MVKERNKTHVKGIARVKKFKADQDETVDEPTEIVEKEFELTKEQIEQVKQGKPPQIR